MARESQGDSSAGIDKGGAEADRLRAGVWNQREEGWWGFAAISGQQHAKRMESEAPGEAGWNSLVLQTEV